jgi:hypothetical protein
MGLEQTIGCPFAPMRVIDSLLTFLLSSLILMVGFPTFAQRRILKMETLENGYVATLDSKKRVTIRNAKYKYYVVRTAPNGVVVLQPQKMVPAAKISKRTLAMMDKAIANLKEGKVSEAVDLSEFLK